MQETGLIYDFNLGEMWGLLNFIIRGEIYYETASFVNFFKLPNIIFFIYYKDQKIQLFVIKWTEKIKCIFE